MYKFTPNLNEEGKYTRILIGAILIIAGIIGLGRIFLLIAGVILVVEGVLGWGSTPLLIEKFLKKTNNPPPPPPVTK